MGLFDGIINNQKEIFGLGKGPKPTDAGTLIREQDRYNRRQRKGRK